MTFDPVLATDEPTEVEIGQVWAHPDGSFTGTVSSIAGHLVQLRGAGRHRSGGGLRITDDEPYVRREVLLRCWRLLHDQSVDLEHGGLGVVDDLDPSGVGTGDGVDGGA